MHIKQMIQRPLDNLLKAALAAFLLGAPLLHAQDQNEPSSLDMNSPGAVFFIPPKGWRQGLPDSPQGAVKLIVVGQGKGALPPSINLAVEPFAGSLNDYLKIVKAKNAAKGLDWKDLGKIKTKAGEGSLSELDTTLQWGNVRMLHTILVKNGHAYIVTAAALRDEFPSFYKEFFEAMQSLQINDSPSEQ